MPAKRKQNSNNNNIEEGMRLIQQCPLCDTAYEPLEIKVVDETENTHLVHVTCRKCAHAVVALITNQLNGLSSVGLITDAAPEDIARCQEIDPVNWDDCLAWHALLKQDQLCKEKFLS